MKTEIRIARPEDATQACEVLCRSIQVCCTEDHQNDAAILAAWLGNKTPDTVSTWFQCPTNHSIVAIVNGEIAGVAIMTRQGKIVLCYVSPEVRFTGAGRMMLQALETQAREWGVLSLQVNSTLTAKSFYERNGYIAGATCRSAFGTEGILFSKRLAASYAKKTPCRCTLSAG